MSDFQYLLRRSSSRDIFVCGFDTARGDSQTADGDDFSLIVTRIPEGGLGKPHPCKCVRHNNIRADQMAAIVHENHREFGFACICYDPGGGGLFVRDELAKPMQLINGEAEQVFPLLDFGDSTGVIGDQIMTPFRRSAYYIKLMWRTMTSDSVLINRLHGLVRNAIQMQRIELPPVFNDKSLDIDCDSADELRRFLNMAGDFNEIDRNKAELHLMVLQLMLVDIERDKETGRPKVDSFGMFKFLSKSKKDSAYAFLYSQMAYLIWKKMVASGFRGNNRSNGRSAFAAEFQMF